ncbi:MAG TPA: acyltransferase family protein [Candidatus Limnocylindrales bacterium]|jgi:peptidoglycan/LPS O-acetylase OafA/YrhL
MTGEAPRESATQLGYQPALDGIRALAVLAVLLYHSGYTWMSGGFLGVDVFFVLSGFLITSLLLGEWSVRSTISLPAFYQRRARRLLPALFALLIGVCLVSALFIPDELGRLRGEVAGALTYVTNWYLILQQTSYFQALGRPSPLQHLWSLAVEEQYYVVWPVLLLLLLRLVRGRRGLLFGLIAAAAVLSTAEMWVLFEPFSDPSRVYFGTDTRAATLLVGSALAVIWRPDALARSLPLGRQVALEIVTAASLVVVVAFTVLTDAYGDFLYHGGFLLVAVAAAVLIAAVTHPAARFGRTVLGHPVLRWFGVRSYAIYLWHWPLFVITRPGLDTAWDGLPLLVLRLVATVALADLSYRLVELPIRHGAFGRWVATMRRPAGPTRTDGRTRGLAQAGALGMTVLLLGTALLTAGPTPDLEGIPGLAAAADSTASPAGSATAELPDPSTGAPTASPSSGAPWQLPVKLLLVGDSQANMLDLNAPSVVGKSFQLVDGWVEGCGVLLGRMTSSTGYRRNLDADCHGWVAHWQTVATTSRAPLALVVLGAWDVFDLIEGGHTLPFGTPGWDAYYSAQLQSGIDILKQAGSKVALLELPCYRPIASSAGPALPERADDSRTRHVNTLLAAAAAADPTHVYAITPPPQFCTDQKIATDVYYRWDGVHYGRLGSQLVFRAITPQLLAIPQG